MNFSFTNLKVGSLVEIETIDANANPIKLKTIVENIISESELKLFAPIYMGKNFPIRIGDSFELITVHKYPTVDKYDILSCRCKVSSKTKEGNISTITVIKTGIFKPIQRRNYFRLPLIKNMTIISEDEEHELLSKDLSASGIRGFINKKIPVDTEIILLLNIETGVLRLKTRVIDCYPDPHHTYRYELRGSFVGIKNTQMSALHKYIFSKQSEAIKKQIEIEEYASILDTNKHYSDFYSMTNLEKVIRISPIITWALTLLNYAFLYNAFEDQNKAINYFFRQFKRTFRPEYLNGAYIFAFVMIVLIAIGALMNNGYNKGSKRLINIQYAIQGFLALAIIVAYQFLS